MGERRVKPKNRKPTFFWQGVLILAPMLVLAKLGALALWQDKRMAQHEATLRAQDAAEEAAQVIWNDLQDFGDPPPASSSSQSSRAAGSTTRRIQAVNSIPGFSSSQSFYYSGLTKRIDIDREDQLVFPPPYEAMPTPQPLDPRELSEAQRTTWDTARAQEANAGVEVVLRAAAESYRGFLASSPPTNFAAAAHFALGNLLAQMKEFAQAITEFSVLTNQFPNRISEAGLPLDTLARFKIFEAQRRSGILQHEDEVRNASDDLLRYVIQHPSALTPEIMRRTPSITNEAAESWLMINGRLTPWISEDVRFEAEVEWKEHEQLRRIYRTTHSMPVTPSGAAIFSMANHHPLTLSLPEKSLMFWMVLYTDFEPAATAGIAPHPLPTPKRTMETRQPLPVIAQKTNADGIITFQIAVTNFHTNTVYNTLFSEHQPPVSIARTYGEYWLIVRVPTEIGAMLLCRSELTTMRTVEAALRRVRMPEYLEASVRIADADVISSNRLQMLEHVVVGKGGGQFWQRNNAKTPPAILASSTRGDNGRALLAVSIHLISPDRLYAQQEERATLFKLLIGASALASIVGFFTARRAFYKQLRLAEMKSNFVSSVSHELRAPIASVRLMAEGLERGKISEPAKQHEYYRFITQECRRLSSMIENVLDFARIEQGRKQYEFEPTDVAALVEKTVTLMEPYAEERGVKLRLEGKVESGKRKTEMVNTSANATNAEPNSPSPWGEGRGEGEQLVANIDGQAIQQTLVNLIDNAIKHSPGGEEVVVSLAIQNSEPSIPNSQLLISVEDHGPGIPATEHEKIFERFYRLGSELRRETPGVGIGLSIVKHVVEAHDGRVRVESEVGKGSRFTIELPLNHQDTKAPGE